MEKIKESHKILKKNYTISKYLKIPYVDVVTMNSSEREYMFETIKSAIERGVDPQEVLTANYEITKAKLFITENNSGIDLKSGDYSIRNVVNDIDVDVIYDAFTFNDDIFSTSVLSHTGYDGHEKVYIKYDEKIDKISKGDLIYMEIFGKMYTVTRSKTFKLFELNGKYNIVNIIQYKNGESIR